MSRVKIEDLKTPAKDLDIKEMKKLYGGEIPVDPKTGGKFKTDGGINNNILSADATIGWVFD